MTCQEINQERRGRGRSRDAMRNTGTIERKSVGGGSGGGKNERKASVSTGLLEECEICAYHHLNRE